MSDEPLIDFDDIPLMPPKRTFTIPVKYVLGGKHEPLRYDAVTTTRIESGHIGNKIAHAGPLCLPDADEEWMQYTSVPLVPLPMDDMPDEAAADVTALLEEVINAYSGACADWQTNSMRELLIEEQIADWRARLAALLGRDGVK